MVCASPVAKTRKTFSIALTAAQSLVSGGLGRAKISLPFVDILEMADAQLPGHEAGVVLGPPATACEDAASAAVQASWSFDENTDTTPRASVKLALASFMQRLID